MADVGAITGILGSVVAVGGFGLTVWKTRNDKKAGVSTDERETRRDTVEDRDRLIDQFQEELARVEQRSQLVEAQFEARLSRVEQELISERNYNAQLLEHIWTQQPPPPPKRLDVTA